MCRRVFVSFDFDQDKSLKDLLIAQSHLKKKSFQLADFSLREKSKSPHWESKARKRIQKAGMVMVLLGEKTYKAHGVKKEIAMARELHKEVVQVVCKKKRRSKALPNAGPVYPWKWNTLKKILENHGIGARYLSH